MIKNLLFVIFLTLFSTSAIARDYKTTFHAKIITENVVADSECNNNKNEVIPISEDLISRGWVCVLLPKRMINNIYGVAIACQNKNGALVNTSVQCPANQSLSDKGEFTLDDMDEKVKGTQFILTCNTTVGDRI